MGWPLSSESVLNEVSEYQKGGVGEIKRAAAECWRDFKVSGRKVSFRSRSIELEETRGEVKRQLRRHVSAIRGRSYLLVGCSGRGCIIRTGDREYSDVLFPVATRGTSTKKP